MLAIAEESGDCADDVRGEAMLSACLLVLSR